MEEERQQILSSASNSRQMNIECQGDSPAQTLNQSQNNVQQSAVEVNSQNVQENIEQAKVLNNQQNGQSNISEQYWQSKKNGFIQELNKLLIQGIDLSEQIMFAMPQEILSQKIQDYFSAINDQSSTEQIADLQRKLIKESCLWIVEGKNCNDFDLIKLCTVLQEYTKQCLAQISDISQKDFDFYRDIIGEWAEKKNYGLKLTKDIQTLLLKQQNEGNLSDQQVSALKIGLHEIWEVKEIQCLSNNTKIEELDYIRKKRRQHQALLRGLEKLIKAIEKGKGEDEAFSAYQKTVMNPPKMKVQTKINGKSNSQKQNQVDKSIEDNLKKMKIDSGKVTPIDVGEMQNETNQQENSQLIQQEAKPKKKTAKKSNKKAAEGSDQQIEQNEDTQKQSICESSVNNNSITQEQSKQISSKKNQNESKKSGNQQQQQSASNTQKDNNQKNLLSFFAKKNINNNANVANQNNNDINSNNFNSLQQTQTKDNLNNINDLSEKNTEINQMEIKTDQQQPAKPVKSLLRRIGGADPRPSHLQTTDLIKDTTKNQEVFQIIKQECKKQWNLIQKKKQNQNNSQTEVKGLNKADKFGRRKILVLIHDFVRQYRNVYFDQQSKIINPRNFLSKDEDLIQYDLDSEDEEQELNAENIENEEDDIDEEDQDDDDSAKQFVVPDGYLSDEGFDSDKEDIFDQKKLTFQNYNFVENANKQGFIFQEKDKAGDVQNFLINYKIKKYDEQENFPLCLKKKTNTSDGQAQPTAVIVWTNERLKQFIRAAHGSYQPKKALLEQISKIDIMKDVSKNRLEKKFKEIIQKDDKQDGEAIKRWCVHQAIIESLEFEENEMEELKKQRQEEYKSTRQSKKDEKITNQQQNSALNLNNLNNNQQNGGVQQQIKPIVGLNIFSSAAPLKKNMNITPIKSVLKSDDEEEKQELEIAEKKQKERMIEEAAAAASKKQEEEKIQQSKVEKKVIQLQRKKEDLKPPSVITAEENSQNQIQNSQQNEQPSRKNSNSINENSNTSQKKQKMLQLTLQFNKKS